MKRTVLVIAGVIASSVLSAAARGQVSTLRPATSKVPGVTSPPLPGGYQGGADDCASPHTVIPPGPQTSVPWDTSTATTGTTGQNEPLCVPTNPILNDVWFDWQATVSGWATWTTCGGTSVNTKIAVYPLSTCPADGTALACNDGHAGCPPQSSVTWQVTAGTSYTFQLGTRPFWPPGAGTMDISYLPPVPCGTKDDGSTENALGLTDCNGEIGWIKVMHCITQHDTISTAYGTAMFPGTAPNGNASQIVAYENPTGSLDPNDPSWVPTTKIDTVVVNGNTDILNPYTYPTTTIPPGHSTMVLATALMSCCDICGPEYPAPIDANGPFQANPNVWWVATNDAPLNTTTLTANTWPPRTLSSTGNSGTWLLRLEDTSGGPGTPVCFGDGSGAPCGCGNESVPGSDSGCRNSVSPGGAGAALLASGSASLGNPDLTLDVSGVLTQPGLFFQGVNTIGGGTGATFGDGIRCCGGSVLRLSLEDPPPGPEPTSTSTTLSSTDGSLTPGDKRCYQYWYRDPGGPCAAGFNLTNAVTVIWNP